MSEQQFHEEEPRGYQPVYTTTMQEEDVSYEDRGQKVYPKPAMTFTPISRPSTISAGQRLALAIVSASILVPIAAIVLEGGMSDTQSGDLFILGGRLIALALICLTIMVVNLAFNRHR